MHDMTLTLPTECPFGEGKPPVAVRIVRDVKTDLGNVIVPAGYITVAFEYDEITKNFGSVSSNAYRCVYAAPVHYAGVEWASVHAADLEVL